MRFPFYEQAPKEVVQSCNCCGGKRYRLVATVDRYRLNAPAAQCNDCGLIFLSYRMTPEAYGEFYEKGHYRELFAQWTGRQYGLAEIESDQKRYADTLHRLLLPHMESRMGGLLLDLGGSTGIVAEAMAKAFNLDATVVEPSADEAARAHAKGLAVAQVGIDEYSAGGNHYDLILLCRTVDHLLDVKGTLGRIRQWLAPSGLFFVDFMILPQTKIDHPYLIYPPAAKRYLEQAGFKVIVSQKAVDGRHFNMLAEGA